jgi:hypothetical protein
MDSTCKSMSIRSWCQKANIRCRCSRSNEVKRELTMTIKKVKTREEDRKNEFGVSPQLFIPRPFGTPRPISSRKARAAGGGRLFSSLPSMFSHLGASRHVFLKQSIRHFASTPLTLRSLSTKPNYAFAFDIDGVLIKVRTQPSCAAHSSFCLTRERNLLLKQQCT